jgi:3-polyprenyl-4-hydroxybenzoate decarboxylase
MPFRDFREFLNASRKPGELLALDVPAQAEFVIELEADPIKEVMEGPAAIASNLRSKTVIVVNPSAEESVSVTPGRRTGSAIGIDATYPSELRKHGAA